MSVALINLPVFQICLCFFWFDFEIDYEAELYSLNDSELIDLIDFDNIKTENLLDQDNSYNYFVNTISYEDDLLILD